MTLYSFLLTIVKYLLIIINGKQLVIGKENIPEDVAIIASTHRHWLDPIILALAFPDKEIAFMAKDTLFKNSIIRQILTKINVFPVNREKPSAKSLRHAITVMNEEDKYLGIFPTGSRYSTEVKGGTAFIQRLSKKNIIPVAVQPPMSWKELFARKQIKVAIGPAIKYDEAEAKDKDKMKKVDQNITEAFAELDKQLDPNYVYVPKKKTDSQA
ncbi:lysophospholipid acyltransferase family protein [Aerococcaceae bacterium WGS1372]